MKFKGDEIQSELTKLRRCELSWEVIFFSLFAMKT